MFLRVKDGIVNLASIQYLRRVQSTITLYFESDFYDIAFKTEDEAVDYLCGISSLVGAKKLEGSK